MSTKSPNYRLLKKNRSYTVREIADRFGIHKITVRRWVKEGLQPIDSKKPMLILGEHAIQFLKDRRKKNKSPCRPNEIYCVKCRVSRVPAENMAEIEMVSQKIGNLVGLCPVCSCLMNKRVSVKKIPEILTQLDVSIPQEVRRIVDS